MIDGLCYIAGDGGGNASHLRIMLSLVAYRSGTSLTSITRKLNSLLTNLIDIRRLTDNITFRDIRQCLLSLENHCHSADPGYNTPEVWDVAVGDVGYVRDNKFVRLCNVRDDARLEVTHEDLSIVKCDPQERVLTERISTELIRYDFPNPAWAGVQRLNQEITPDTAAAVRYLLEHGAAYMEAYGKLHHLCLHDIIMVTANNMAWRRATYEYQPNSEDDSKRPPHAYLFERTEMTAVPWAYWSLDKEPNDAMASPAHPDIVTVVRQNRQTIAFVQLENADITIPENRQ